MHLDKYLSTKEFAERTGYSDVMIRKLIRNGILKADSRLGSYLIPISELKIVKEHRRNTDWMQRTRAINKKSD